MSSGRHHPRPHAPNSRVDVSTIRCRVDVARRETHGSRVSAGATGRRRGSPGRDNGAWSPAPRPAAIPDAPGSYQFLDAEGRVIYVGKAKSLRSRLSNYFLQPELLLERTRQMVHDRRERRVDRRQERGRGLLPRVQPHQAAQAPLQHPPEGRQELPVPRGHARRGLAPRDGAARRQAQGRALLRPVRARVRDPRDARPAAAHVPDPHVHEVEVRPPPPARAAVPLRAHREVRGAVRRRHRPRRLRQARPGAPRLPRRRARRGHQAARAARWPKPPTSSSSSSRPACATSSRACARRSSASRWSRHAKRTSTSSASTRTRSKRACRSSTCARGESSGARGSIVDKVEDVETPALVARIVEQLYADATGDDVPKEILVPGRARGPRAVRGVPRARTASTKVRIRVPAARRQARAPRRPRCSTRASRSQRHKLRRASDHNARARALVALQEALDLPEAPLRIECFDISNLQGTEIVGSMVVMEDGLPEALRLPPLQGARPRRARTTSRRWKTCSRAASATTSASATRARTRASGSRTRRTCC